MTLSQLLIVQNQKYLSIQFSRTQCHNQHLLSMSYGKRFNRFQFVTKTQIPPQAELFIDRMRQKIWNSPVPDCSMSKNLAKDSPEIVGIRSTVCVFFARCLPYCKRSFITSHCDSRWGNKQTGWRSFPESVQRCSDRKIRSDGRSLDRWSSSPSSSPPSLPPFAAGSARRKTIRGGNRN